jgi:four helix bundle protein
MENEYEKPTTFFRFEDLRIYHKALEYSEWVYSLGKSSGDETYERFFLEKFLTSANGIALNIAEGSSRNKSQFVYYLKMAKSAIRECVVVSTIIQSRGIITKDAYDYSKNQLMEMTKMIGALIGSLQRSVKPDDQNEADEDEIVP